MAYKSQLGYIMDLLDIVGTDLATTLNLDRTLISKWKNGSRQLTPMSKHFNKVVEALIFFNSKRKDATLERFFGQIYPNEDKNEPEYLEVCLNIWLKGQEFGLFDSLNDWKTSPDALYATKIEVFKGNAGKKAALLEFLNYAHTLPPGQEIFISDLENPQWKDEDPIFSKTYYESYLSLIDKGHNFTLILPKEVVDKDPTSVSLFRFKTYFTGRITSYSIEESQTLNHTSLYIIHRHMAVTSTCIKDNENQRYVSIHKDPFSVAHYVSIFMDRISKSQPLLSNYAMQGKSFNNFLLAYDERQAVSNVIFVSPEIGLPFIPSDILSEVLSKHHVSEDKKNLVEGIYKHKKHLIFKHLHDFELELILSKELLENIKTRDFIRHETLSELSGQDILIPRKQMIQILNKWLDLSKKHPHLNISVIPFDPHSILKTMNLYLFEDSLIFATQLKNREYFIASESKLILNQIQKYLNELLMLYEEETSLEKMMEAMNQ